MFAPITSHTESVRFEAETQERQRRAEFLANAQLPQGYSLFHDVIRSFTNWATRRQNQPVTPSLHETATDCC